MLSDMLITIVLKLDMGGNVEVFFLVVLVVLPAALRYKQDENTSIYF